MEKSEETQHEKDQKLAKDQQAENDRIMAEVEKQRALNEKAWGVDKKAKTKKKG